MPKQKTEYNSIENNRLKPVRFVSVFVVLSLIICFIVYFDDISKVFTTPIAYKKYTEFGIRIPTQYKVHGIDVSHHQGEINWKMVKDMCVDSLVIDFVFVKATEGRTYVDKQFKNNWKNLRKNKLIRGAYHYFKPLVDGKKQAKHFISKVKLKKGDLPPVIDIEEIGNASNTSLIKRIKDCVMELQHHYGVEPIIYTYHDFYKLHLNGQFDDYLLWIAHYNVLKPNNNMWNFWQHSDRGTVSGINYPVDFNVFNRSKRSLEKLLIK